MNLGDSRLNLWLFKAAFRLYKSLVVTEPVVISSESMNERRPVNLHEIHQLGSTQRQKESSTQNLVLSKGKGHSHGRYTPSRIPLEWDLISDPKSGRQALA